MIQSRPVGAQTEFRPHHDYVDRTEYGVDTTNNDKKEEVKKYNQHVVDFSALYRQPLLNYNINEVNEDTIQVANIVLNKKTIVLSNI